MTHNSPPSQPETETLRMPHVTQGLRTALGRACFWRRSQRSEHSVSAGVVTEETPRPEIVSLVSNLLQDETIITERETLEAELGVRSLTWSTAGKPREDYQLEDRYRMTHVKPRPRLMLGAFDSRKERIAELLMTVPRIKRGTWSAVDSDSGQSELYIDAHDKPIEIPIDNIVYAGGLRSWEGRGYQGSSDKFSEHDQVTRTSAETIDYYMNLSSEIPPIGLVYGYIQPNGLVFFEVGEGSHRAAAAMKRGYETLSTTCLKLYELSKDIFDIPFIESESTQTVISE